MPSAEPPLLLPPRRCPRAPQDTPGLGSQPWSSPLPSHHRDVVGNLATRRVPNQPLGHLLRFCGCSEQAEQQRGGTAPIPPHSHGRAGRQQPQQKGTAYRNPRRCPPGRFSGGSRGLGRALPPTLCPPWPRRAVPTPPGRTALASGSAHPLLSARTSLSSALPRRKQPWLRRETSSPSTLVPAEEVGQPGGMPGPGSSDRDRWPWGGKRQ